MTKEIINKKIGERIKIARKNANLTLLELANKIGLSEGNVQRYESGNITNVSVSVLEKFATALNTTTAILMGWENSNEPQKDINKNFSPRVERDIQKRLQSILDDMNSDAGLAFYNGDEEMDEETKELLKISLETSIRTAKKLAQEKFTPKKYKNEQSE
ncbi:helix-turn-helix transcriptional regulator [Veillonella caviae]|uniref:helix-turn-helix domain-containing protein n=1 Tax=Veillonella caviae TaxID=248316 RepID=UPI002A91C9FF|nr:helix-turn-helix transcriptional regulator [Veillonella caviae]MDY5254012.1 helix-turn-helix transcriptional regulator [Veillonella caviae]